ncbi:MAG: efflux RND transporter periplasmic adaptor subunit [Negativicutes bacterium]
MRKFNILAIVVVVIIVLIISGCGSPKAQPMPTAVPVKTAKAVKKDVPVEVKTIGHVEALNTVNITPRVTGKIIAFKFKSGDMVNSNDLIAVIDPQPFEIAVAQAQANIDKIYAQQQFAALEYTRNQPLLAAGAITSEALSQLKSQADFSAADLVTAKTQMEQAKINLGYCYLRSPLAGKMGDRLIDVGNIVTANSSILTTVNQFQPLHVTFFAPERYVNQINEAFKQGTVPVSANDDKERKIASGKLVFIDNVINKTAGTIQLKAEFANNPVKLVPGQYVTAVASISVLKAALTVPSAALQPLNNGGVVFTVETDNKVKMHTVKIVQYYGDDVVITGDIQAGQTVVVDGQLNLRDGALVKTQP